jgi:lipopolysaccharide export LptBFGC system permease protein LptF
MAGEIGEGFSGAMKATRMIVGFPFMALGALMMLLGLVILRWAFVFNRWSFPKGDEEIAGLLRNWANDD